MSTQCVYTIYTQNVYTPIHTIQNNQQRSLSMKHSNKKLPSEHRRYFKDRIEEYQPLIDFASDPQNKKIIDKLTQVLGEMRKQERYHNNRTYYPRILKEPKKN